MPWVLPREGKFIRPYKNSSALCHSSNLPCILALVHMTDLLPHLARMHSFFCLLPLQPASYQLLCALYNPWLGAKSCYASVQQMHSSSAICKHNREA